MFFLKEIENIIGDQNYTQKKVNQWTANVVWKSVENMIKMSRRYKYVINCTIMERTPNGFYTACCCSKDNEKDRNSYI